MSQQRLCRPSYATIMQPLHLHCWLVGQDFLRINIWLGLYSRTCGCFYAIICPRCTEEATLYLKKYSIHRTSTNQWITETWRNTICLYTRYFRKIITYWYKAHTIHYRYAFILCTSIGWYNITSIEWHWYQSSISNKKYTTQITKTDGLHSHIPIYLH